MNSLPLQYQEMLEASATPPDVLAASGMIPPEVEPWVLLPIRSRLRQPLGPAIANLTVDEVRRMIRVIEGMDSPVNAWLEAWELQRLETEGFWKGTVLPLLKRRMNPPRRTTSRDGSIFERAKKSVDIAELAGRFTRLTPVGKRLKGCCPIHEEKTASFNVMPEERRWHCFGCGRGGDAIELVRLLIGVGKWIKK